MNALLPKNVLVAPTGGITSAVNVDRDGTNRPGHPFSYMAKGKLQIDGSAIPEAWVQVAYMAKLIP